MAPRIPALAQSEPKSRFIDRLMLDHLHGRHIYALLTGEAAEAWLRLMSDRSALLPNLRYNESVQPPYSVSQISETAMHREILNIYTNASPETKPYYELAHDTDTVVPENWICRWTLWHVFRNRDQRKKSSNRAGSIAQSRSPSIDGPRSGAITTVMTSTPHSRGPYEGGGGRILPYDPTRDH